MKVHSFEQYSPEWWEIRRGLPTASCANKILTPTGKLSATSDKYLNALLAEKAGYSDDPMEPTEWMLRGLELEPEARNLFKFDTDLIVTEVGFITNDEGTAGCSPDGIISDLAGLEIKCPKASTHIGYLRDGGMPAFYAPQVHFSMAICELSQWYFMSYYPGLDPLIVLVKRDSYTDNVASAINDFTARIESEAERLKI